eukprot:g5851.t1
MTDWSSRDQVLAAVKEKGLALKHADPELKKDRDIVLAAVKENGYALPYADPELKKDRDVVLAAVKKSYVWAFKHADPELKKDRDFVLAAVEQYVPALKYADPELKKDRDFVLAAVKQNGLALEYADPELNKDRDFVLAAVRQNGEALEYADPELKKDRDIVLAAVWQNGLALQYADPELKKDRDIVLAAVERNWYALHYADPELKKDRDIVLAAVEQNGEALQYADPELKKDRDIVLVAVKQDEQALYYADPELKNDKTFILAAVNVNRRAVKYVGPGLLAAALESQARLDGFAMEGAAAAGSLPASPAAVMQLRVSPSDLRFHLDAAAAGGRDPVGRGNFGTIFKCDYLEQVHAYKEFDRLQEKQLTAEVWGEIELLATIPQHRNVVNIVGVGLKERQLDSAGTPFRFGYLMPFADRGSVRDLLDAADEPLPWKVRESIIQQACAGLAHLHAQKPRAIFHGDVKAANLLAFGLGLRVAIADFGVAKIKDTSTQQSTGGGRRGTPRWSAPECYQKGIPYLAASDVFSFGMTVLEVGSRKSPWAELVDENEVIGCLTKCFEFDSGMFEDYDITEDEQRDRWLKRNPLESRRPSLDALEAGCPEVFRTIIHQCWADDPAGRASPQQLLDDHLPEAAPSCPWPVAELTREASTVSDDELADCVLEHAAASPVLRDKFRLPGDKPALVKRGRPSLITYYKEIERIQSPFLPEEDVQRGRARCEEMQRDCSEATSHDLAVECFGSIEATLRDLCVRNSLAASKGQKGLGAYVQRLADAKRLSTQLVDRLNKASAFRNANTHDSTGAWRGVRVEMVKTTELLQLYLDLLPE